MGTLIAILLTVWATAILLVCGALVHSMWVYAKRQRHSAIVRRVDQLMRGIRK